MINKRVKKTIACAQVESYKIDLSIIHSHKPQFGEVALVEVLELGKHVTVQGETKRLVSIFEGDYLLAAFANRYATEQFEGYVPDEPTEYLDILGAGGAIGLVKSMNVAMEALGITRVKLAGYAKDESGNIINTVYRKTRREPFLGIVPNNAKVILSVGSSMDSGKTTTAAYLARGLKTSGKKVVYMKLTGTSYTKDRDLVYDCGADYVVDFIEAGYPSTYMIPKEDLLDLYQTLLRKLEPENPDYIIIEIADGLVQRETEFLLRHSGFMNTVDHVVFSAADSLAAFWGISFLSELGCKPTAVGGLFTTSPLLIEEVRYRVDVPVLTLDDLASAAVIPIFERKASTSKVNV